MFINNLSFKKIGIFQKRKKVKIQINVKKQHLVLLAAVILIASVGIAIAVDTTKGWHSCGQVDFSEGCIADGTVTGADIKDGTVTSTDIADGTLTHTCVTREDWNSVSCPSGYTVHGYSTEWMSACNVMTTNSVTLKYWHAGSQTCQPHTGAYLSVLCCVIVS